MRKPELIQEQIRHLDRVTHSIQQASTNSPEHFGLKFLLQQDTYQKEQLVAELRESIRHHRGHVLSYIFKTKPLEAMKLDTMLSGLSGLRDVVRQSCYAACGQDLPLNFETVFQGSFGIMLSTPPDGELIQTKYQTALKNVLQTIDQVSKDDADIKTIIHKQFHNNRKAASKYSTLFKNISESDHTVEISWIDITGDVEEVSIATDKAKKIHEVFLEHGKKEPYEENLVGHIKGVSLLDNSIQFQVADKDKKRKKVIKARFPEDLSQAVKESFDKKIEAVFYVEVEYNEATDQEKFVRTLISTSNFEN